MHVRSARKESATVSVLARKEADTTIYSAAPVHVRRARERVQPSVLARKEPNTAIYSAAPVLVRSARKESATFGACEKGT